MKTVTITCDICGKPTKNLEPNERTLYVVTKIHVAHGRNPKIIEDICEDCNSKLLMLLGLPEYTLEDDVVDTTPPKTLDETIAELKSKWELGPLAKDFDQLARRLREECETREDCRLLLTRHIHTERGLEQFARHVNIDVKNYDTSKTLTDKIIETTIGYRLRSPVKGGPAIALAPYAEASKLNITRKGAV